MGNYPAMTYAQAKSFNEAEGEWSKAAQAAWTILAILKVAKTELGWCATHQKTSQNIADRWNYLQLVTTKMLDVAEQYSASLVKKIESELERDLRLLDEANVDFDAEDNVGIPLEQELEQYAETIIEALKQEMHCDQEGDEVEARAFDNNR